MPTSQRANAERISSLPGMVAQNGEAVAVFGLADLAPREPRRQYLLGRGRDDHEWVIQDKDYRHHSEGLTALLDPTAARIASR